MLRVATLRLAAAYARIAAGLLAVGIISGIDDGPIAVVQILTPHVALACVLLIPVAIAGRSRSLWLAIGAAALLFVVRFGAEWTSPPAAPGSDQVTVATWNIQSGASAPDAAVDVLRARPVDVVAIQELTPDVAAAINADPVLAARYPHRFLEPRSGVSGAGLLSAFPILEARFETHPVRLEARVHVRGVNLVVLNAHPFPARLDLVAGIPAGMNPESRDEETAGIRARVAALEAEGLDVLLIGDFNTAPTEGAFDRLTDGLHDAHAEVGWGPGWTWRPARFAFLGTGLLRIDLILTTDRLTPVSTSITCSSAGDHCLLEATLTLPESGD